MNTNLYSDFDKRILILNKIIIAFLVLITVLPMGYILIASFMDPQVLANQGISLNPQDWTVDGYKRVLGDNAILRGFINSLIYS
ncbi:carbohydrate ABC transporter permease, partial [Streptococcus uberis]